MLTLPWLNHHGGLHKHQHHTRTQDVTSVVDTCHEAGISKKAVKLRPIAVIKG